MVSHVSDWRLVVVCEPDESTLESLCDHMTADRFNVLPAPTAADALRHCRFNDPDLMLLDVALPETSGLDVLRQIRQAGRATTRIDPELPIIVMSGMPAIKHDPGEHRSHENFLRRIPGGTGSLRAV
jgi:DNA-binding response OmpR family regulator